MLRSYTNVLIWIIGVFGFAVISMRAQTTAVKKASFEVASVRLAGPFPDLAEIGLRGNRFTATLPLEAFVLYAYELPGDLTRMNNRIIGAPEWLYSSIYDIQAIAENGMPLSHEVARLMLQSLLEDRFQLKAHFETRESTVYNLLVAKGGLKMKLSQNQGTSSLPPPSERGRRPDARRATPEPDLRMTKDAKGRTLTASSQPLDALIPLLANELGHAVIDKTGTQALYDFEVHFPPRPSDSPRGAAATSVDGLLAAEPAGSIFKALADVGLRLELARGPATYLVIDSVQKPSEN